MPSGRDALLHGQPRQRRQHHGSVHVHPHHHLGRHWEAAAGIRQQAHVQDAPAREDPALPGRVHALAGGRVELGDPGPGRHRLAAWLPPRDRQQRLDLRRHGRAREPDDEQVSGDGRGGALAPPRGRCHPLAGDPRPWQLRGGGRGGFLRQPRRGEDRRGACRALEGGRRAGQRAPDPAQAAPPEHRKPRAAQGRVFVPPAPPRGWQWRAWMLRRLSLRPSVQLYLQRRLAERWRRSLLRPSARWGVDRLERHCSRGRLLRCVQERLLAPMGLRPPLTRTPRRPCWLRCGEHGLPSDAERKSAAVRARRLPVQW
mmetsp:Transcript_49181/g.138845  ORF Transcript_49181/g.138845 Transcript_49181/m.138845 type:complete len:314 (-) Transcript_49181:613-1554(-)